MWDLAPHDISILLYTLGALPVEVSARGGAYVQRKQGIHDVVNMTLRFPQGTLATVRVSWLDPNKIRRYTVVGSAKMLVYDDIAPEDKILIYDKKVDMPPYSDTEEEFRISYHYGDVMQYPVQWVEPLRLACQHFIHCCATHTEPRSSGTVGMRVVEILEVAQASLMDGGCGRVLDVRELSLHI
jgi:predicted dehydrogenase